METQRIDMIKLARKIQLIENRDADYAKNPKWQALRRIQDRVYIEMALEEMKEISEKPKEKIDQTRLSSLEKFMKNVHIGGQNERNNSRGTRKGN